MRNPTLSEARLENFFKIWTMKKQNIKEMIYRAKRGKKIMEKLNRAQKCSILGPQNLGSMGWVRAPRIPLDPQPNVVNVTTHQKSKTGISVAPQKGLMSSKIFLKKIQNFKNVWKDFWISLLAKLACIAHFDTWPTESRLDPLLL